MMKWLDQLKRNFLHLSPKRKELFATFCLNMAVASLAVAAFEGKWWGILPAIVFILGALYISKGI